MKGYQYHNLTFVYVGQVELQIDPITNNPLPKTNVTTKAIPADPVRYTKTYQWIKDSQEWKEIVDNSGEWFSLDDGHNVFLNHFDDSVDSLAQQIKFSVDGGILTNKKGEKYVRSNPNNKDYPFEYLEWDTTQKNWMPTKSVDKVLPVLTRLLASTYESLANTMEYTLNGETYTFQVDNDSIACLQNYTNLAKISGGITWFDVNNKPIYFTLDEITTLLNSILVRQEVCFTCYQTYKNQINSITTYDALVALFPNYTQYISKEPISTLSEFANLLTTTINNLNTTTE